MDPRAVAGVAESALDEDAELPPTAPAAPWTCRCDAIVWSSRPSRLAGQPVGRPVFGALLAYHESPVGPYREVQGLTGTPSRHGLRATVPFIAVDSAASVLAGRLNWALPKALAEFTGEPVEQAMTATGSSWTVSAIARPLGPAVPTPLAGQLVQTWPDGQRRVAKLTGRASARPALIRVSVRSRGALASWLRPGRHLGLLLLQAEFTLSEPAET
jgi:hypothetical protein